METFHIAISDINAGLKGYLRYSQCNNSDKNFGQLSFNECMAIVTHFLHNRNTEFAKPFEMEAIKVIDDIYQWKMKQIGNGK